MLWVMMLAVVSSGDEVRCWERVVLQGVVREDAVLNDYMGCSVGMGVERW